MNDPFDKLSRNYSLIREGITLTPALSHDRRGGLLVGSY